MLAAGLSDHIKTEYDILVIGGGITGVGAALDAVTRGLSTLLVEADDFACGTSSRSSKLVHGGIRYLESFEFGLVRESLQEQKLLLEMLAPYHVKPLRFTMPLYKRDLTAYYMRMGSFLYDTLGNREGEERSSLIDGDTLQKTALGIKPEFGAALSYQDAVMDDARFVFSVAHTASRAGADLVSNTRAIGAAKTDNGFRVSLESPAGGSQITTEVRARHVILCGGVLNGALADMFGGINLNITASKGTHILIPRDRFQAKGALVSKTAKSVLFIIPFEHHWVIGTTDDAVEDLKSGEIPTAAEIDYLITEANKVIADPLSRADVIGAYAGVRPLVSGSGKESAKLSRSHVVKPTKDGAMVIAGGKYTTYRAMARDGVNKAISDKSKPSITHQLPLWGAKGWQGERQAMSTSMNLYGLSEDEARRLAHRYGLGVPEVLSITHEYGIAPTARIEGGGPLIAELIWGVREEAASTLTDLLHRRLRLDLDEVDGGLSFATAIDSKLVELGLWDAGNCDTRRADFMAALDAIRPRFLDGL